MISFNRTNNNLYTFIQKNQNIAILKTKIEDLNIKLNQLDVNIANYERLGLKDMAEQLTVLYNKTNLELILLSLKLNELEKQTLLFELEAAIAD